jgi:predicted transcriptional regulator
MSGIPEELQDSFVLLKGVKLTEYDANISRAGELFSNLLRSIKGPKFYAGSPILYDEWVWITLEKVKAGVDTKIILTEEVIRMANATLGKREYIEFADSAPNYEVLIPNSDLKAAFVSCSNFMALRAPLKDTGYYDTFKTFYGDDKESIRWGFDFFDYYKKNSKSVKMGEYL